MHARLFVLVVIAHALACQSPPPQSIDLTQLEMAKPATGVMESALQTIGGSIEGLSGGQVRLQLNGVESIDVSANGGFRFTTQLRAGVSYWVMVSNQPLEPRQYCAVTQGGSGTVDASSGDGVHISCKPAFVLSGSLTGLQGTGLRLQVGQQVLEPTVDGLFVFDEAIADGDAFVVSIARQPSSPRQFCTLTNGSGTVAGADVFGIQVVCSAVHRIFVTSTKGTANLGSWPDAAGATGLAAADATCMARARAGGLGGTFVAWLSDGSDDAFCRVLQKHGRRDTNCGETALPAVEVGPWMTMDDKPFAETLEQAMALKHWYSPRTTEIGMPSDALFYRVASFDVLSSENTCVGWTSAASTSFALGGAKANTGFYDRVGLSCDAPDPFFCIETGKGPPLPAKPAPSPDQKKAFISIAAGTGSLQTWSAASGAIGVAAGDAICTAEATAAGLDGTFKAWLSTAGISGWQRFSHTGPWFRLDGVPLGTRSSFANAPETVLLRNQSIYTNAVWIGSTDATKTCADFTSAEASANATVSYPLAWDGRQWLSDYDIFCSLEFPIYCFQD